jgi:hypothetical protein
MARAGRDAPDPRNAGRKRRPRELADVVGTVRAIEQKAMRIARGNPQKHGKKIET